MLLQISTSSLVHAGSIGFSISFTGDEIVMVNTGSDAAYQLSGWTLDSSSHWRQMQVQRGNTAYLLPGQSLLGRRLTAAPPTLLGRADPLLLVMHDQVGSRIAQLAWRQSPAMQAQPVPAQRGGNQLGVVAGDAQVQKITATDAIVLPYDGIARLTRPLVPGAPPPDPVHHPWGSGAPLMIPTGAAQAGVWLVHETSAGDLRLQIVGDGVVRGQEQVPVWLVWGRKQLKMAAVALASLGLLVLLAGFTGLARRDRVDQW